MINIDLIDTLVENLRNKYNLSLERKKLEPPYDKGEFICGSNKETKFRWIMHYEREILNNALIEDYDEIFNAFCYQIEKEWTEHCKNLLLRDGVLTNQ